MGNGAMLSIYAERHLLKKNNVFRKTKSTVMFDNKIRENHNYMFCRLAEHNIIGVFITVCMKMDQAGQPHQ